MTRTDIAQVSESRLTFEAHRGELEWQRGPRAWLWPPERPSRSEEPSKTPEDADRMHAEAVEREHLLALAPEKSESKVRETREFRKGMLQA